MSKMTFFRDMEGVRFLTCTCSFGFQTAVSYIDVLESQSTLFFPLYFGTTGFF
jgi:hypothetical protein